MVVGHVSVHLAFSIYQPRYLRLHHRPPIYPLLNQIRFYPLVSFRKPVFTYPFFSIVFLEDQTMGCME